MDISKFRDIVAESYEYKTLLEAPFWKSARASGEERRANFIKKLDDSWEEWLGMTGASGTQRDMINFLITRVGFSRQDTARILDISNTSMVNGTQDNLEPDSDEKEQSSKTEEDKTKEESNEKKTPKSGYEELKNYKNAYNNLNYGLDKKIKTIADTDIIYRSFEYIASNTDMIPDDDLRPIEDTMQDAANYLENIENTKYRITPADSNIVLGKLQKRMNKKPNSSEESTRVDDSVDYSLYEDEGLLDQPLTKQEVKDILNDAASYAFTNNIIGNKNYARANGDYSQDNKEYRSNGTGLSKPVEKATYLNDFAQKVFNTSAFSGLNDDTISNLRALSKKSYDQITDEADRNAMANIGWAFLRNLR